MSPCGREQAGVSPVIEFLCIEAHFVAVSGIAVANDNEFVRMSRILDKQAVERKPVIRHFGNILWDMLIDPFLPVVEAVDQRFVGRGCLILLAYAGDIGASPHAYG